MRNAVITTSYYEYLFDFFDCPEVRIVFLTVPFSCSHSKVMIRFVILTGNGTSAAVLACNSVVLHMLLLNAHDGEKYVPFFFSPLSVCFLSS